MIFKMAQDVEKVWGKEIWMINTEKYCGKILYLKKGKRCSMHFHKNKDETFYVQQGKVLIELWEDGKDINQLMKQGDSVRIKPFQPHRFNGLEKSTIIEISTTHEESDSYRIENMFSGDIPEKLFEQYLE